MPIDKHFSIYAIVFSIMLLPLLIYINGCDDSGIVNTNTTDSNVVIYKNLAPTLWFKGIYDTSHQTVNLWEGQLRLGISSDKDIVLIDQNSDTTNFYFRSGDLSIDAQGMQTRFNRIYSDLDSSSKFDSLSVIPDSNNELDSTDFTQDDTYGNGTWSYFSINQTTHPVYSFYLKGKYANNQTNFHRIYGVFYIKNVAKVSTPLNGGSFGVQITIDVKLNKIGANHFKP